MSLTIYLDDCAYDKVLAKGLRAAGHQVVTPFDAGIAGRDDPTHFQRAMQEGWVLLTKNPRDFIELHLQCRTHAGLLVIYQDNDPRRDMNPQDIISAIRNLEVSGASLAGEVHSLNQWRY